MDFQMMRWLSNREVPEQAGNEHPVGFPTGVFETADGLINLSAGSDHQMRAFIKSSGCRTCWRRSASRTAPHAGRTARSSSRSVRRRSRSASSMS
jgi:crotonobetainyl-CoA:carnitine CoA-transferase CaiB-like acyl-CoA transferase